MLVRIKKRGEIPCHGAGQIGVIPAISNFRGCLIEVVPGLDSPSLFTCGGKTYVITDSRFQYLIDRADLMYMVPALCEHFLIDDLEAYDSDFCDEQAQEGDLAFAQLPVAVRR